MNDTIVSAVARALLQALAGVLISRGWIGADEAEGAIGALTLLVALAWSVLAKRRAAADLRRAEATVPASVAPVLEQATEAAKEAKGVLAAVRAMVPR